MIDKKANPFTYNDNRELYNMFNAMVELHERTDAALAKATRIAGIDVEGGFKKLNPLPATLTALPNYRELRNGNSGSGYTPYRRKMPLADIDKLVNTALEAIERELSALDDLNAPIIAQNTQLRSQITELMVKLGVPSSYTTYEYPSTRSRTKKSVSHTAGYIGDLNRAIESNPSTTKRSSISLWKQDYARWAIAEKKDEEQLAKEKDEAAFTRWVIDCPELVEGVMLNGINILQEVRTAVSGHKAEVIQMCISQAISKENAKPAPDEDYLRKMSVFSRNVGNAI